MKPVTLMLGLFFVLTAAGAEPPTAGSPVVSWREKYTLGPGDVLNFRIYGYPDLDRSEVFVRPDGTIGYLQAANVRAEGLSIDELRAAIETDLARYYRYPRVIITPFSLRSKRYFMLGKVVDRGAFTLEQPLTLLEAVARARGIETGLFEQNTVELADLPRSFIMRGGQRLPVDFEKLFFEGDLKQNVEIEPGDYVYFAAANTNEVYVFGEIGQPGVLGFTPKLSAVGAITVRGGFTPSAYQSRVLVVRGSLEKPERFVVDVSAVLSGQQPDFLLQPKDIVYVSRRPWRYAEELLDTAVGTFLQSMTSTWTSRNVDVNLPSNNLPQFKAPPK
jgi:protein involved in polysaccharide export with SLBB domain